MRACSSASGGVFFIPDEIERKSAPVSYRDLVKEERDKNEGENASLFGKKPSEKTLKTKVA